MKPGSKAWTKMIAKFFFVSRGIAAFAIILLLFQQITGMHLFAAFFGVLGFGFLGVFSVLAAFAPIHESPRWEIVFPELRKKSKS